MPVFYPGVYNCFQRGHFLLDVLQCYSNLPVHGRHNQSAPLQLSRWVYLQTIESTHEIGMDQLYTTSWNQIAMVQLQHESLDNVVWKNPQLLLDQVMDKKVLKCDIITTWPKGQWKL